MTLNSKIQFHLARYAFACFALFGLAVSEVRAAVVYYQPNGGAGWVVPSDINGLYINVETQQVGSGEFNGWDLNPYTLPGGVEGFLLTWYTPGRDPGGSGFMALAPGQCVGIVGSYCGPGSLSLGAPINSSSGFATAVQSVKVGSVVGEWRLNDSNYFGFSFLAAHNQIHYGWGRMDIGASLAVRSIMEIGYEDVAGAGASPVSSVPGPLPLLGAAAAFGWSRRLRRRCLSASGLPRREVRSRSLMPSS